MHFYSKPKPRSVPKGESIEGAELTQSVALGKSKQKQASDKRLANTYNTIQTHGKTSDAIQRQTTIKQTQTNCKRNTEPTTNTVSAVKSFLLPDEGDGRGARVETLPFATKT